MKVFEGKVFEGLKVALAVSGSAIEKCSSIGVAVSGGADSVSLLFALKKILPENILLKAVTINHNIRPVEETSGDADFVESLCRSLGVKCVRYEIERGLVEKKSKDEKNGIEDSARKLRYEKFSQFIIEEKVDFLCLAHNKNDQEETILMRLLQGSDDLAGIPRCRGKFLRPLLEVSRQEIESYLERVNVSYRTDSTNFENDMMRNRIRNILVPVLNENFAGWKKGLENLSGKSFRDNQVLENLAFESLKKISWSEKNESVTFNSDVFFDLQKAIKDRILMKAVKIAGPAERISQSFISRWSCREYAESKKSECSSGLKFSLVDGMLKIEKKTRVATEEGFFAIIEEPGVFSVFGESFQVRKEEKNLLIVCGENKLSIEGIEFPFAFRSRQPGDEVKNSDGTMRSLSGILDGWKACEVKDKIPVIQKMGKSSQDIKCIWGSLFGFSDWIVME